MENHEKYMLRCVGLAKLGAGYVAPNPMVGALLVHNDRIIGEGYHEQYGEAHAEVNCINSVKQADQSLIQQSTMYVSLEPCVHFGKTPPCADLIINHRVPKVVIGCRDPFVAVNGKGIEKLEAANIAVTVGVLENDCKDLNKRFFCFHLYHRPYIILKWAETGDGKISGHSNDRLRITNEFTTRLVHKWRSEEASILVGTNTALMDDPLLTTRLWAGNNPIRLVIDMDLKLPASLQLFSGESKTVVFNKIRHYENEKIYYYQVTDDVSIVQQISNALYQLKIQSVIVEGGARLLQSFIDEEMWDEARVISNDQLIINQGLNAPVLSNHQLLEAENIFSDQVRVYGNLMQRE